MFSLLKISELKGVFLEGKSHCRRHAYLLTWRTTQQRVKLKENTCGKACDMLTILSAMQTVVLFRLVTTRTIPVSPSQLLWFSFKGHLDLHLKTVYDGTADCHCGFCHCVKTGCLWTTQAASYSHFLTHLPYNQCFQSSAHRMFIMTRCTLNIIIRCGHLSCLNYTATTLSAALVFLSWLQSNSETVTECDTLMFFKSNWDHHHPSETCQLINGCNGLFKKHHPLQICFPILLNICFEKDHWNGTSAQVSSYFQRTLCG